MIKTEHGNYKGLLYCVSCDWFQTPESNAVTCCPKCGSMEGNKYGALPVKVERYVYECKTIFGFEYDRNIIGVEWRD